MNAKTGSGGRPWVELSGPKPPPVDDVYDYWVSPPPKISARCTWWLDQISRGWLPNRNLRSVGRGSSVAWYGVWVWEYENLLRPAINSATNTKGNEHG